jgi:methyl coenzyme M reductase subunit D
MWCLESGLDESCSVDKHIQALLSQLEGKADAINQLAEVCEMDIFCGYSSTTGQGGFVLDSKTLKDLTKFPLDLTIDLYGTPEVNET